MSKLFVIIALPSPILHDQAGQVAKLAKTISNTDAYWVSSWVENDVLVGCYN